MKKALNNGGLAKYKKFKYGYCGGSRRCDAPVTECGGNLY